MYSIYEEMERGFSKQSDIQRKLLATAAVDSSFESLVQVMKLHRSFKKKRFKKLPWNKSLQTFILI